VRRRERRPSKQGKERRHKNPTTVRVNVHIMFGGCADVNSRSRFSLVIWGLFLCYRPIEAIQAVLHAVQLCPPKEKGLALGTAACFALSPP
jgi:hypothetical protein